MSDITRLVGDFSGGAFAVFGAIALVIGAIQCFFGYRIFKALIVIVGALLGGAIGALVGALAMDSAGAVIFALIFGVLGGFIAFKVYKVGVFANCFVTGALIGLLIGVLAESTAAAVVLAALLGITFGVLAVLLTMPVIIISTAVGGGFVMGLGMGAIVGANGIPLFIIVFSVIGAVIQFRIEKKKSSLKQTAAKTKTAMLQKKKQNKRFLGSVSKMTHQLTASAQIGGKAAALTAGIFGQGGAELQNTRTTHSTSGQTILVKTQSPLWREGMPVVLTEEQIVKTEDNKICLNLGIQNIASEEIIGVFFSVYCYDLLKQELQGIEKLAVQDISIAPGELWFSEKPFALPDADTRRCTLSIKNVVMADGTIWSDDTIEPLVELPVQRELKLTPELRKELCVLLSAYSVGLDLESAYRYVPEQHEGYWSCACGQLNTRDSCLACKAPRDVVLSAAEPEYLSEHLQQRQLEQRLLEEERQKARKERLDSAKLTTMAVACSALSAVKAGAGSAGLWLAGVWLSVRSAWSHFTAGIKRNEKSILCGCGEKNPSGSIFCQACGERLDTSENESAIICRCGEKNPLDSVFCQACGERLEAPEKTEQKSEENRALPAACTSSERCGKLPESTDAAAIEVSELAAIETKCESKAAAALTSAWQRLINAGQCMKQSRVFKKPYILTAAVLGAACAGLAVYICIQWFTGDAPAYRAELAELKEHMSAAEAQATETEVQLAALLDQAEKDEAELQELDAYLLDYKDVLPTDERSKKEFIQDQIVALLEERRQLVQGVKEYMSVGVNTFYSKYGVGTYELPEQTDVAKQFLEDTISSVAGEIGTTMSAVVGDTVVAAINSGEDWKSVIGPAALESLGNQLSSTIQSQVLGAVGLEKTVSNAETANGLINKISDVFDTTPDYAIAYSLLQANEVCKQIVPVLDAPNVSASELKQAVLNYYSFTAYCDAADNLKNGGDFILNGEGALLQDASKVAAIDRAVAVYYILLEQEVAGCD